MSSVTDAVTSSGVLSVTDARVNLANTRRVIANLVANTLVNTGEKEVT
jgi:hypothetical protein